MRTVRAAGGVVVRDGRVLLVHRPRYDDWTFPKGKAEEDESDEMCALREVEEETGLRCVAGAELQPTSYVDSRGRPKRVRWWLMQPLADGGFAPNDEIGALLWATPGEAAALLTYERDRVLLAAALRHERGVD